MNIREGGCDCRLEVNGLAKHLSLAWISEIDIVFFLLRLAYVLDINEPQGRLTISYLTNKEASTALCSVVKHAGCDN